MSGSNADYLKPKMLPIQIVSDIQAHCEYKKYSSELKQNEYEILFLTMPDMTFTIYAFAE